MKAYSPIFAVAAVVICLGWPAQASSAAHKLTPKNLRCEYLVNPRGIDVLQPRLSWTLQSEQRGQLQSAYRILVASSLRRLEQDTGDLWDSGKVASSQAIQIPYGGRPPASQMRCYWKVRLWDQAPASPGASRPCGQSACSARTKAERIASAPQTGRPPRSRPLSC
jgi:hypothetical protein